MGEQGYLLNKLYFMDVLIDGRYWYFFDMPSQSLLRVDTEMNAVQRQFSDGFSDVFLAGHIHKYEDCIYIFNAISYDVWKYNVTTKNYEIIKGDENNDVINSIKPEFGEYYDDENTTVLLPNSIDIKNGKTFVVTFNYDNLQFERLAVESEGNINGRLTSLYPTKNRMTFYAAQQGTNVYYTISLREKKIQKLELDQGISLQSVLMTDERVYFAQKDRAKIGIIEDGKTNEIVFQKNTDEPFSKIIGLSEHICILPKKSSTIVLIDSRNDAHIINVEKYKGWNKKNGRSSKSLFCWEDNANIYVAPCMEGEILKITKTNYKVEKVELYVDFEVLCKLYPKYDGTIMHEGDFGLDLNWLINSCVGELT